MPRSRFSRPLGLALVYGVGAMSWIIGSDLWLAVASAEQGWGQAAGSIVKGTLFVIVTALVFYWFACRIERAAAAGREDLQAAHDALLLSEAHYRALFAESRAVMLLIDAATGLILDANEAAVTFYGWPREELVGRAISTINTSPEEKVKAGMARAKAGQQRRFTYSHRRADGSVREVEVTSGPVTLRDRVCLYSVVHDITERIRVERELRDSLALKQAIWDCSALGLIVYEAEGRAVQVNTAAARIVGATVEELDGHNFRASQPWRRYGLLAACERALAGGHLTEVQTQMVTEFGKSLWLGVTFTPFHFQDRPHVLVAFQDLSTDEDTLGRLKLLESALEAAPEAFVITDTHGRVEWVNSAFTSITGYKLDEMRGRNPNLLKSGRQDDAFYKKLWETITTVGNGAGNCRMCARMAGSIGST